MEVSGALVQQIERRNGICSSSSSLSCTVLDDTSVSEILKQPGDLTLPNVKCNEESRCAGSFQPAFVGFSDKQVNSKVDSVTDYSIFEKPVRKKKKNNKNRGYSSKMISDKIVSTTGESKYDVSDPKPSFSSIKEGLLCPFVNSDKGLENYTPLVNSTSLCEIQVEQCSEDPNIHNCDARVCCKGPDKNKQGCEVCNSSHAFRERNAFKRHNLASEIGAVNKTRNHLHVLTGKVNSQSVWQKRQRSVRETQTSEPKRSQCNYVQKDACMLQKNFFAKHNSFLGKGLLPSPLIDSSRLIGAVNGTTNAGNKETKTDLRLPQKVLVESSEWAAQQRLTRRLDQHVSQSSQEASRESDNHEEEIFKLNLPFKPQNYCRSKKGPEFHGVKIPGMNHVLARSFHASTNTVSCKAFKQFNEHQFRKDVTSGMSAKKWAPVGTKGSSISDKTGSASIFHVSNGDLPFLLKGDNNGHSKRNIIDYHASAILSKSNGTNLIGGHSMNTVKTEAPYSDSQNTTSEVHHVESAEARMEYVRNLKNIQQLIFGLQMVTDPLNAAYKMQLVSEGFEIATGCPLAEFERFLVSSAPVIASSYLHAKCSVCLGDQFSSSSLCKHQIPNTSLFDVWKWYEEPGNYGLKVKAGDSQYVKGLLTESTSFHAHFAPYLSAVRLFGYSHLSNSYCASEECSNPDMHIRNSSTAFEGQHHLAQALKFGSIDEQINSYNVFCSGCHSKSFIPSPACSSNCELVFEFFETEKPWLRKPLLNKIVDLIDAEHSYLRGFGDPSKLKSLKLNDLHPASWFSVAWYPIYRIPEGKFGAAFLTYHSLGHLVLRDVPTDSLEMNTLSVVSPVVALLSYKAQAECWFDLKMPVESSFRESSLFNWSEILRKQLKILEENASLFARGCVWTDGTKTFNCHQDYGFFSSQK